MTADSNQVHAAATTSDACCLTDARSLAAAIVEEVHLQAHDPTWVQAFELEREHLAALLPGRFVAIAHIGSAAIPGLTAKPIHAGVIQPETCANGSTWHA